MRTTLTLDDDVAAKIEAERRRSGASLRAVVNAALRAGLSQRASAPRRPFVVVARDLGDLRPGLSLDDVSGLIETLDGPRHR